MFVIIQTRNAPTRQRRTSARGAGFSDEVGACEMRISIAIAGIFLAALAGRAAAAEVPAASRVDAVTVFLSGAEVTRTAQLNLDKGEHTIVFSTLA